MRLLVTGASGFVGRGLLPWLTARGHGGVATGRTLPEALPPGWRAVRRDDVLEHGLREPIDAVIHLEVKQHVPQPSAADIEAFEAVNVGGTRAWLGWAAAHGIQTFVHLSTVKAVVPTAGSTTEEATLETQAPYGRSKARAEQEVRRWAAESPQRRAVILRSAPVYGPGNSANLAAFARQVLAGKPCLIGAGLTRKSIVSRTNLVAAIEFAATNAGAGCEVFNVSDASAPSLQELATTIAELGGARAPRRIPAWLASVAAIAGDCIERCTGREFPLTSSRLAAIREATIFPSEKLLAAGYHHPQTTREGLAEMIAWIQSEDAKAGAAPGSGTA